MLKLIRVNTNNKTVQSEALNEEYKRYGGRGLIARLMNDIVNPACDPLGPENKIIVAGTLMAGTAFPTAHRLSFGGKSPLTKGIKEANVGGTIGTFLAQHGIRVMILEDQPADQSWSYLHIDPAGSIQFKPADEYVGKNSYEFVEAMRGAYGKDVAVAVIGPAGERLWPNSSIQVTDFSGGHPSRAAARGGLGAVFGSKKIKGIVVEKAKSKADFEYVDKKRFMDARLKAVNFLNDNMLVKGMNMLGTPAFTDMMAKMGALPYKNFSGEKIPEAVLRGVESQAFANKIQTQGGKTGQACQAGCIVKCSNTYCNPQGQYVTSGLEYETIGMFGPNCGISDMDAIAEFDRLCDELGVDTIETADSIGVAMEAGKLNWGDTQAALGAVQEMIQGTEFGTLLGQGTGNVGQTLGVKRTPAVKGQGFPAYDPRALKTLGVTYAVSPMGADHTAGHGLMAGRVNQKEKAGHVDTMKSVLGMTAMCDSMMCLFLFMPLMNMPRKDLVVLLSEMLAGAYGDIWNEEIFLQSGTEIIQLEKSFNLQAGLTAKDDMLPEAFSTELSSVGTVFDFTQEELQQFFAK